MPVTYDDIKERKLGREAMIRKASELQLENELAKNESDIIALETEIDQQSNENEAINEQAYNALAEMERIEQEGGDVMAFIETLDPVVQERLITIINGENEQAQEQNFVPIQQLQQQVPITDRAKQLAQL